MAYVSMLTDVLMKELLGYHVAFELNRKLKN